MAGARLSEPQWIKADRAASFYSDARGGTAGEPVTAGLGGRLRNLNIRDGYAIRMVTTMASMPTRTPILVHVTDRDADGSSAIFFVEAAVVA